MFFSKKLQKFKNIKHCFFSRKNGVSKGIYESLNCGIGSKDQEENVKKNLDIVSKKFNIKKDSLALMHQTHSNKVEIIVKRNNLERIKCDAMLTKDNEIALPVLTADCLPILIYEKRKEIIGCIHAGWKGAVNGIIENTLKKLEEMNGSIKQLVVSLGPCISQKNYEVKNDFYSEFIKKSKNNDSFFFKNEKKTFNFDLRGFGRRSIPSSIQEIKNDILYQMGALQAFSSSKSLQHLKPHGALYNDAVANENIASAICDVIEEYNPEMYL